MKYQVDFFFYKRGLGQVSLNTSALGQKLRGTRRRGPVEEPFGSHWHTAVWFEERDHVGGLLLPVPLLLRFVTSARSFL